MPSELRRITFNADELNEALVDYDKLADQKFTCGVIVSMKILEKPVISIAIDVNVYGQSENLKITLDARYLGAAMVMYCLNNCIPIPTNSVRYLKKIGKNLALCFSINESIDGPATVIPDYFDYGSPIEDLGVGYQKVEAA